LDPLIFRAAQTVREARHQLLDPSPANLCRCTDLFAVARSCLESVQATHTEDFGGHADLEALRTLRRDIVAVGSLLEKAAVLHLKLLDKMRTGCESPVSSPAAPA
jgi:hypothetical protein